MILILLSLSTDIDSFHAAIVRCFDDQLIGSNGDTILGICGQCRDSAGSGGFRIKGQGMSFGIDIYRMAHTSHIDGIGCRYGGVLGEYVMLAFILQDTCIYIFLI